MTEMIPVTCSGQFFYVENRQKNFRSYEVEVQLPSEEVDRALWFIKKNLIDEAIQSAYPEVGFVGVRTVYIQTALPQKAEKVSGGDVVENIEDVQEDMFAGADTVVDGDEFGDIEEVVSG